MMSNDKYCYDIHHNLAIDYVNGEILIGSCCQSGRILSTETKIDQFWNLKELIEIRTSNKQNKLSESFCHACTKLEATGNQSRRNASKEFYDGWDSKNKNIRALDIKLGNLCNLKCTICGPDSSTSWIPDAKKLGLPINNRFSYDKNYNNNLKLQVDNLTILQDLEMVKFWGGEPLLDEKHADILEFLDQQGILKNCRIVYNTNATQRVSDRVLELWSRAHLVELYFSIDDIGKRFEYQRYGANWDQVVANLQWYHQVLPSNHLFYIMTTVSYLNLWYLPELYDWKHQNFNTNRMEDPVNILLQPAHGNCSVEIISTKLQKQLVNRFEKYPDLLEFINFFKTKSNHSPEQFLDYVNKLDQIRKTQWSKTFDEFSMILND
jgi:hypothetical protein